MAELQKARDAQLRENIAYQKQIIEEYQQKLDVQYNKVNWSGLKASQKYLAKLEEELKRFNWFFDNQFREIECDYHQYWNSKVRCDYCEKTFKLKHYRRGDDDLIYCGYRDCPGNLMDFHVFWEKV